MNDERKYNTYGIVDYAFRAEEEIDPNDPWHDDVLGRRKLAKYLTSLAQGANYSSFVIGIHGTWGSGKTFMLQRWKQQLINSEGKDGRKYKAIYFNAWEDDFHTNPLVAIIGQLWMDLKDNDVKEIYDGLKQILPKLAETTVFEYIGLKKELLQSDVERTVNEYVENRKEINELRRRLENFANAVMFQTHMPLIFIIDELDRCRPTFAIELLERIKHIFNVKNIVFVCGMNKTQLEKSIKSVYGEIDAEEYLRKFFDINLSLPPAKPSVYCKHMIEKYGVIRMINSSPVHETKSGHYESVWQDAINNIHIMVDYMNLSLRDTEQVFRMIFAILSYKEEQKNELMFKQEGWKMICFIFLRIKNFSLYQNFTQNKCMGKDVINYMLSYFPDDESLSKTTHSHHIIDCKNFIEIACYDCTGAKNVKKTLEELRLIIKGNENIEYTHVSERVKKSENAAKIILEHMNYTYAYDNREFPKHIANMLEWGIH